MKKLLRTATRRASVLGAAALLSQVAFAQTPAPAPAAAAPAAAPTPEHTFTPKVSVYSEYEYRGISQTSEKPALQLNLDYSHSSGFYAGAFLSNIKWIDDTKTATKNALPATASVSGSGSVELDLFLGYKWEVVKDFTLDFGYLRYEYVGSEAINARVGTVTTPLLKKPNTDELYIGFSSGPFSTKYSRTTSDAFGVLNSKGSTYFEINLSTEIAKGLTFNGTAARATYKNNSGLTYNVYKAGATYDLGDGWNVGGYYKKTNAIEANYTVLGRDWSKGRLVAFVSKSF